MTVVLLPQLFFAATFLLAGASEPPQLDLSNPKVFIGLLIGGIIPYLFIAILALITKWLLFSRVFNNIHRPSPWRFCSVALLEPFCLIAGAASSEFLAVPRIIAFVVYAILATFPNLLLFSPLDRKDGAAHCLLKRSIYAFGAGLIILGWWFLIVAVYWYI